MAQQQDGLAGGGAGGLLGGTLAPDAGVPPTQSPGGPTTPPPPQSFTSKMLDQAQGRFDAVEKAYKQLGRIEKGLDTLRAKGDAITDDDVLDEMAELVAHGADPKALAKLIAGDVSQGTGPMPPGGEPLAGWLKNIEDTVIAPAAAQLRPAMALAQHQLGVAAVHHLVESHPMQGAQGGASPTPPSPDLASTAAPSPLLH